MYYIILAAVIALDQLVKFVVRASLAVSESIPVIPGIFHITYVRNTGAAFSIFAGHRLLLIALPVLLIVGIIIFIAKNRRTESPAVLWSLALIGSGGVGNLIDRFVFGYVTDMFDFRIWPVFNVADIAVCGG
ncbi:MAG: signal peptidase II, partial [Clostridia bacterium]|nr:signal peptidase II [Clostridia bacterium]